MPCVRRERPPSAGCGYDHLLVPEPALGVRMHEARLDRARPDQRDLHDDVVEMIGLGVQDRIDLRATLDLKRADRLAALDEVVRLRVVDAGSRTSSGRLPVRCSITSNAMRTIDSAPSPRKSNFGTPMHVEIVLVELDDRAAHRRLLDRQIVAERRGREHEAADMRRSQPRQSFERPAARRATLGRARRSSRRRALGDLSRIAATHSAGSAPCTRFEISNACSAG